MKTYIRTNVYTLALLMSALLSACAAIGEEPIFQDAQSVTTPDQSGLEIIPLGVGATLEGLKMARNAMPSTFIMASDKLVLMGWKIGQESYGFLPFDRVEGKTVWDMLDKAGGFSNMVSSCDMGNIVGCLYAKGFKFIGPNDLPLKLAASIDAYVISSVQVASSMLVNIIMIPVSSWMLPEPETTPL